MDIGRVIEGFYQFALFLGKATPAPIVQHFFCSAVNALERMLVLAFC
jgi:hypothetical protein